MYTKGEWKIEKPEDELVAFQRHELGGRPAIIIWVNNRDGTYHEVALCNEVANAQLIASAPVLYEACKTMRDILVKKGYDVPDAEQALAKAEGK